MSFYKIFITFLVINKLSEAKNAVRVLPFEAETQEKLKSIIKQLHEGNTLHDVKKQFERLIKKVSPNQIAAMENTLKN